MGYPGGGTQNPRALPLAARSNGAGEVAGEPRVAHRRDLDAIARLRRVDEPPAPDVDADVVVIGEEEHQVAGLQLRDLVPVGPRIPLVAGVAPELRADLAVGEHRQAAAVDAARRRAGRDVRHAEHAPRVARHGGAAARIDRDAVVARGDGRMVGARRRSRRGECRQTEEQGEGDGQTHEVRPRGPARWGKSSLLSRRYLTRILVPRTGEPANPVRSGISLDDAAPRSDRRRRAGARRLRGRRMRVERQGPARCPGGAAAEPVGGLARRLSAGCTGELASYEATSRTQIALGARLDQRSTALDRKLTRQDDAIDALEARDADADREVEQYNAGVDRLNALNRRIDDLADTQIDLLQEYERTATRCLDAIENWDTATTPLEAALARGPCCRQRRAGGHLRSPVREGRADGLRRLRGAGLRV